MKSVRVYLSIPISCRAQADFIEATLAKHDIEVLNPCKITPNNCPKERIPSYIANECWAMIEKSDAVILYTDYYGRDCSAEMGYAFAKDKPIFPFFLSKQAPFLEEDWMIKSTFKPDSLEQDYMIKSLLEPFSENLRLLAERILAVDKKTFTKYNEETVTL